VSASKNHRQFAILLGGFSCFVLPLVGSCCWEHLRHGEGCDRERCSSCEGNRPGIRHGPGLPDANRRQGIFHAAVLPVGRYELDVQAPGFRGYQRQGIALDTNAALTIDAFLEVAARARR